MPTGFNVSAALGLLMTVMVSSATAQSAMNPPGSVRGLFGGDGPPNPGRTSQQVSAWFDLSGGYDQNSDDATATNGTSLDGFASTALGGFRYWRGKTTRSLEATARFFKNNQGNGSTTAAGGEVNVRGNLEVGRRAGITAAVRAANDSAVLFGAFGPAFQEAPGAGADIDVPDVSPPQGIVEDRWYSLGGNATAYRNWTTRQRTDAQYTQVRLRPTEGDGLESDQRLATFRHEWNFRMNTGLLASYRFDHVRQTFAESLNIEPIRTQTAEAGFRYERHLSSLRAFSVSVTAGAAQVLAAPLANNDGTVEPTGALAASYTFTSRWVIAANASRSITVLQGVAVEPFSNDLASISVTGVVGRRVTLSVTGALSRGDALGIGPGSFDAAGGTAAVRYGFRYGALFTSYTRYDHHLRDVVTGPGGITPRFDQNSVRAGLTIWLPLFGGF